MKKKFRVRRYAVEEKEHQFLAPGSIRWDNAVAVGKEGVTFHAPGFGKVTALFVTLQKKPKEE